MLKLSWLISLGISLIGFMIIEHFFTIQPDGISGSGNLGAVGIALVFPFLILSLFITYRYFSTITQQAKHPFIRCLFLLSGVGLFIIFTYFANGYKNDVLFSLGGPTSDPNSKIYQYPLLNQYTNRIFFNFYTFGIVHSISVVIGCFVGLLKPKKEELPE
nr:nucleoside-diphosphate sugar epimerase [Lysinibacillus timonensis]